MRLIVVCANISTDIFALIEITIMHIFLHSFIAHMSGGSHNDSCPASLIGVIENICISNILGMDTSATFDHR